MRRVKRSRKAESIAKVPELVMAAPQVAAIRTARMLAAGANPGAADRADFSRMGTEKVQAFWESMFAMGAQIARTNQEYARVTAMQWWRLWTTPSWIAISRPLSQAGTALPRTAGLVPGATRSRRQRAVSKLAEAGVTPVDKRATANSRRLARIKKR
jgi:hypothetical protein